MAPKRAASASESASSSKRAKAGPSEPSTRSNPGRQVNFTANVTTVKVEAPEESIGPSAPEPEDVKPDIKPKIEEHTATVSSIPYKWLKYTPSADIVALLLECCRTSPSTDALVAKAIASTTEIKLDAAAILKNMQRWDEEDRWPQIVEDVRSLGQGVTTEKPLHVKIDALKTLADLVKSVSFSNQGYPMLAR
jgi:hypothetical protein